MKIQNIGFIGTGVMGRSMAGHLLRAGHRLQVNNRTRAKAEPLLEAGAHWCGDPGEAAQDTEVVFTIVGYPEDVEETYFAENGILDRAVPGAVLVDMTTSSPQLARRIFEAARGKGLHALDAPVSGGDIGAREARLTIMAGGEEAAFERALPLFEVIGKNILLQGPAGAGQHTKMCNQIAIASGMMGICEALAYASGAGLDSQRVLESIGSGAAASWSLSNLAPRILRRDFSPGFFVKHFIKDMKIAIDAAEEMGLELPGLDLACRLYDKLASQGGGDCGTQALYKLYGCNGDPERRQSAP